MACADRCETCGEIAFSATANDTVQEESLGSHCRLQEVVKLSGATLFRDTVEIVVGSLQPAVTLMMMPSKEFALSEGRSCLVAK